MFAEVRAPGQAGPPAGDLTYQKDERARLAEDYRDGRPVVFAKVRA